MTSTEFIGWRRKLRREQRQHWLKPSKIEYYLAEILRYVRQMPLTKGAAGRLAKDTGLLTFTYDSPESKTLDEKIDAAKRRDAAMLGIALPPKET
jgi:hypothetical protein